MRVLFTIKDFFPLRGGLQASVDKIIRQLVVRGNDCAVLTQIRKQERNKKRVLTERIARKLFKRPIVINDQTFDYPVFRILNPAESLPIILNRFNPDVMMCTVGGSTSIPFTSQLLNSAGSLPNVIYSCDMQGITLTADPSFAKSHVVANAELIASLIGVFRKRPVVIPCIVESTDCMIKSTRKKILYINPHPRKGLNLAWSIAAAAPQLEFVFQESWPLQEKPRTHIIERAKKLGNVEFRSVTSQPDQIYRDARVLLAPYGPERPRVIDEAQANGIPVVACDIPGLDEGVGPGGELIDPRTDIQEWVSILTRLNIDGRYYKELSMKALEHNRRHEMTSAYLADLFERELRYVMEKKWTSSYKSDNE